MMHNKDFVWANIGMHYLAINAFLGRSYWPHLAHSPSKFESYCLGDLAYTENCSWPPYSLLVADYYSPVTDFWQP